MGTRALLPLLVAGLLLVVGLRSLPGLRHEAWVRPQGPTDDRVLARVHADGTIDLTHGPTTADQRSLLEEPVSFEGIRAPRNGQALEALLAALRAFAAPHPVGAFRSALPHTLEIAVDEEAPTAWISWLLHLGWQPDVRLTRVNLRRMPSGRLIALQQMIYGEWEGPRPSDKEEPSTRVVLRRGKLPPKDDRLVLKVGRFKHYVGDAVEIEIEEDGAAPPPPRWRYEARLPDIAAWRTSAGRRRTAEVLRDVRALLRKDLAHIDEVPLDVAFEPIYSRYADMPAVVVLDLLEGLAGLPKTRLQYWGMVEGWR